MYIPSRTSPKNMHRPFILFSLIRCCHPIPSLVVSLTCTLLAHSLGHTLSHALLVGLAVLSGQLAVGWSNDSLDVERDVASGRRDKPAAMGHISISVLRNATFAAILACFPLSLFAASVDIAQCMQPRSWIGASSHYFAVGCALAYNLGLRDMFMITLL